MASMIKLGLSEKARVFHGSRAAGQQLRFEIEDALNAHDRVTLDFSGVGVVTQSYIDEAVGVLILQFGPSVLQRLSFKNCNEDVKAVLNYVAGTRSEDYFKQNAPSIH